MFDNLSESLSAVFSKLKRKAVLTEEDINLAAREIRVALLEADVALPVIKKIIDALKERAIGNKLIESVTAVQQIIKIVNDLLVEVLTGAQKELYLNNNGLTVIAMVGLQGAGKTTQAAKIAYMLKHKKKKVLLASLDVYRPAAQKQLATLAKQNALESLSIIEGEKPIAIAERAMQTAKNEAFDVLILDTAGRLHIDDELMEELKQVQKLTEPHETLLVVDSMIGQNALQMATSFANSINITGLILTRIDGDARGGVALSINMTIAIPILFLGVGEKISELEVFDPERIASRILGMGDIVGLVEKAAQFIDQKEAEAVSKKLMKGTFNLNDFAKQLETMKKMGGIASMMSMMPMPGAIKDKMKNQKPDEKKFDHMLAMIRSMTNKERNDPLIINGSRRKRISCGSGRSVEEVNKLLKMHKEMTSMMKKFGKMDPKMLSRMDPTKLFS